MRISDWSSDVCSSDLVECFLGGARGLLALGRQYRRRTRGREISHFDRRQESDRRGLFQRHVAQRLAIFRTAADRVRRISGETMIPDFFLIDTDAMPTEEDPRNPGKRTQLLLPREDAGGGVVRISHWPAGFTEGIRQMATNGHRHYHRSVNGRQYMLDRKSTRLNSSHYCAARM